MAPRHRILGRAQDQPVQRDLADHSKSRRHMAMGQGTLDLQLIRPGANHRPALEQSLQPVNHIARQFAQIGQGPLLRATQLVAIALPQQHRRG